ncbi:hypothetical protein XCAW_b00036 (plasmid) [Xanthomonas citri subsp. citri Aw12879]|nr:hypothetical protein XCAW_b00036 [Xanthomonas citri subsp. citri Aw12879]ARR19086.1 hypothetical protein B7L65_20825 [Xanthomonas citri pv. citri]ARR20851.1 hypothetical protein B7L67_04035 [Xanthomonas citri pv. citri]
MALGGKRGCCFARLEYSHVVRFSVFRGIYKNMVGKAQCGQKPACGLVRVAHCPYGAVGGGACGQRLTAVGNRLRLSTDGGRCA